MSKLRAFQRQLDVVANNLANLNTTAYKSQQVLFSDLVYRSFRSATGSSGASFGGVNPAQTGTGVQISQINRQFTQGALQETGQPLDFAIRGNGFFVLNDAAGASLYTRAGSFSLDGNGNLVDPATGFYVQRTGGVGEGSGENFGFQASGDNRINIPLGAAIPGAESTGLSFAGNLPSSALPPQSEVLMTSNPFETSSGPATLTTPFSDLFSNQSDYVAGDVIEIRGTGLDGASFDFDLAANTSNIGDLVNGLNAQLNGATATLDASGNLTITADDSGEAFLSLVIRDADANANLTDFISHTAVIQTEGGSGDVFESVTQIFDVQGNAQNLLFSFRKDSANSWQATASLPDENGAVLGQQTWELLFNENGTFSFVGASGTGTDLNLQFNSLMSAQNIELAFDNLSHSGTGFGLAQSQDGFPPGVLANVDVSADGLITAIGTNGTFFPIAQLALASFSNVEGLEALGENYFSATTSSGVTQIGTGLSNGRGTVIGSQLESSNVDITQEFAQLIVAQRAFSANARTITVAEEILEELTNLIR